jgi:hypothetical protein
MSTPWNGAITNGNHHYVRLIFETDQENGGNTAIRFAIYNWPAGVWETIPNASDPTTDPNTHRYITGNLPLDATQGSGTVFLTFQATDSPQTPTHGEITGEYEVFDMCQVTAPTTIYFPVYWNASTNTWALEDCSDIVYTDPCMSGNCAPCFSEKTMFKLLRNVSPKVPVVLVRSIRNDKKMYRVNHHKLGELEFTDEHPFVYKNKVYPFKELLDTHPDFKNNYQELEERAPSCSKHAYVYNFMIDPDHTKLDAMIKMDNSLNVMGLVPFEHFGKQLQKKYEILGALMNNHIDVSAHMSNNITQLLKGKQTDFIYLNGGTEVQRSEMC